MKSQSEVPFFAVLVAYSIALFLLGTGIGSISTLESIARGRHDSAIGIYYRARNIHVRVFRKHPRFITFSSAETLCYYQHVDETTEQQFSFPYPNANDNHDVHPYEDEDRLDNTSLVMEITADGAEKTHPSANEDAISTSVKRHFFHPSYNPPPLIGTNGDGDDAEKKNTEHVYISVARNQPLYEEYPNFLPANTFARIARCLSNHSEIFPNPLDDAFSGTTGFATIFSGAAGVRRFHAETRFNCGANHDYNPLAAFFKASRDIHATGFVMNVLVADNNNNQGNNGLAVDKHVDNTLEHSIPNSEYLPNTVSVLYLNVPHDMQGGHLDIFGIDTDSEYGDSHGDIKASVFPQKNKMARFRGDAYHQVRAYTTQQTSEKRISLVLEQYRVLPRHEKFLAEYRTVVKNGMTMM